MTTHRRGTSGIQVAVVVTMMLLAAYLGLVYNPGLAAQAQTGASAKPIGYLDFLYSYPSQGASDPAIANLISLKKAYPQVPMVMVMNDGDGGGTSTDLAFASAINAMRAVGIVVIGYVYCLNSPPYTTSTGWRNLIGSDSVIGVLDHNRGLEQAIDAWGTNYKVDGIFFDNAVPGIPSNVDDLNNPITNPTTAVYPGHTLLQYYQAATAYAKSTYGYTFVMDSVWKVYPAMVDVADSLTLEVYPHGSPLPSPTTLQSWTTAVGGTSEDYNIIAWLDTTVPSVAYLSSIQSYVGFVDITDTNGQPSTSYQDALVANLNQLSTSTTTTSSTTTTPTTTTTHTTTTTTSSAKPIGYLDFFNVYPSQGASTSAYANLISLKKAYPQIPMVAIVDDGNGVGGAGAASDSNYTSAINAMRAAGIVVLGYVYCITTYGTTPGSRNLIGSDYVIGVNDNNRGLEQAVDAWHSYYTVDGIFFDNAVPGYPVGTNHLSYAAPGWSGHTLLQYYQEATAYAKNTYGYTFVMDNVATVYPAMIGVANTLNVEVYPHSLPLPTATTLYSQTTQVGGISADFSLQAWLQTTVPSVAYLSSIQGYVGFVSISDTNSFQPSASYQDALVANLNQLTSVSTLTVSITQSGSNLYWHISGLTPNGLFTASEHTSQGFSALWNTYTADSSGMDSRQFVYGSGTAGDVITLTVTDVTTGNQATTSYTVVGLSISITQSGSSLYWHISGLTPNVAFKVVETTSQGFNAMWDTYVASSSGTDSRQFVYGSGTTGDIITLTVTDTSTGKQASTSYTLL